MDPINENDWSKIQFLLKQEKLLYNRGFSNFSFFKIHKIVRNQGISRFKISNRQETEKILRTKPEIRFSHIFKIPLSNQKNEKSSKKIQNPLKKSKKTDKFIFMSIIHHKNHQGGSWRIPQFFQQYLPAFNGKSTGPVKFGGKPKFKQILSN